MCSLCRHHCPALPSSISPCLLQVPPIEQELPTLPEHPSLTPVRVSRSLVFCAVFCRSLFVFLSVFFWPLYCMSFLDLRLLITSGSICACAYHGTPGVEIRNTTIVVSSLCGKVPCPCKSHPLVVRDESST